MEVMNVPQARSRISIAPSKARGGKGVLDVLKSIGKAIAPVAIDLVSDFAKGKLGGMMMPVKLSKVQIAKLKKGGAINLKPEMVDDLAEHALSLLPATAKKVMSSLGKSKGMRMALKQGEDLIHRATGKGLFDVLKSLGKKVAPIAIDLVGDFAKGKLGGGPNSTRKGMMRKTARKAYEGEGILDDFKNVFNKSKDFGQNILAPALDKLGVLPDMDDKTADAFRSLGIGGSVYPAGKGLMGMRNRKKSVVGRNGSPYVSLGIGGSVYPAGRRSGSGVMSGEVGMSAMDMPIQLGSPYIKANSPAMFPFMNTKGIQSSDRI